MNTLTMRFVALLLTLPFWAGAQTGVGYIDGWIRPNNTVRSIAKDGNTLYAAGQFTYAAYPTPYGFVVDTNTGAPIPAMMKINVNNTIHSAVPDGNGGWYIAGSFT